MKDSLIRKIASESLNAYDLEFDSFYPISSKSFKVLSKTNKKYLVKKTNFNLKNKYNFLHNEGISNIVYPIMNKRNEFTTGISLEDEYYVLPFIDDTYAMNEIKAKHLLEQLNILHKQTSYKKMLNVSRSKKKMDEVMSYLDYKFTLIESFVRTIEALPFDEFSIPILKNYQYILDAKKVMIKLNKKIINAIKEEKNVVFCFIHNNPKLEHIITNNGEQYLISVDNGKIGIPSLDIARFYVENEDLNFDFTSSINDYFSQYEDSFYIEYFEFLVLLIYIRGLIINEKDYITTQSFIYTTRCIRDFFKRFSIKNE